MQQGTECTELQLGFQATPQPFEDSNRTRFSDRAKPCENAEWCHRILKESCGELRALVGDEVFHTRFCGELFDERRDLNRGGLLGEHPPRKRHPREDIQNDNELEGEDAKKAGDVGDVDEDGVVGILAAHASRFCFLLELWNGILGYLFFQNSPDGSFRDAVACSGEDLRDALVATETRGGHQVNEASHGIGETSNGRLRYDQGAHGLTFGIHLPLPASHGSRRNAATRGGLLARPTEEFFELQNTEPLVRRVVGAPMLGEFVPTLGQEPAEFDLSGCAERFELCLSVGLVEGICGIAEPDELEPGRQAKKFGGLHQGPHGRSVEVAAFCNRGKHSVGKRHSCRSFFQRKHQRRNHSNSARRLSYR